eukprot:2977046-Amphidinium_carterae.3
MPCAKRNVSPRLAGLGCRPLSATSKRGSGRFTASVNRIASQRIFVHIIVLGYMLLGLNTVCDAYFTGAAI